MTCVALPLACANAGWPRGPAASRAAWRADQRQASGQSGAQVQRVRQGSRASQDSRADREELRYKRGRRTSNLDFRTTDVRSSSRRRPRRWSHLSSSRRYIPRGQPGCIPQESNISYQFPDSSGSGQCMSPSGAPAGSAITASCPPTTSDRGRASVRPPSSLTRSSASSMFPTRTK